MNKFSVGVDTSYLYLLVEGTCEPVHCDPVLQELLLYWWRVNIWVHYLLWLSHAVWNLMNLICLT